MKEQIFKVLEEILISNGYQVVWKRDELIAEKEGQIRIRYLDNGEIDDKNAIYITLREIGNEERRKFEKLGITVWDRHRLMYEIGRAVILDLEGGNWELKTEEFLPASQAEVVFIKSFPIRYRKEEIERISQAEVGGVSQITLKFVPYWKYSFRVHHAKRIRGNTMEIKESGHGLMNAVNGFFEEYIDAKIQDSVEIDCDYRIDSARMDKEEAINKITEDIISRYTKKLKMKRESGDSYIVDTVVLKPLPKDVEIDVELIYMPVWEVSGKKGTAFYNATTGELFEMPADDDVEILS